MAATAMIHGCLLMLSLLLITCSAGNTNRYPFADPIGSYCYKNPKYNGTLDLEDNIISAIKQIVKITRYSSYCNVTVGEDTDNVIYGLAQCRRDVGASDCSQCIKLAAKAVTTTCQYAPDGRVWYDRCFLRYLTENFVQQMDTGLYVHHQTPQLVPSSINGNFSQIRYDLFVNIIGQQYLLKAENRGFGKATMQIDNYNTLYGLVQCTQDIDPDETMLAMTAAVESFPDYCGDHHGCVIASSSCYVKYDLYPFFTPSKVKANFTGPN